MDKSQQIIEQKRRCNIKCKRKKHLITKCYELAKMCNLQISLLIYDQHVNVIQVYSSNPEVTLKDLIKSID